MLVKRLLQFNLLISVIIAVCFIAFPGQSLSLYGITTTDGLLAIAQYFGTTHVAFAVLLWLALHGNEPQFLRAIVASFFVGDLAGSTVLLFAQLHGIMNAMGWGLVVLSFLFTVGYGYGLFRRFLMSNM